ncbi:MAG: hypothetical protein Q8L29_01455 [archaeon]|nr:hypothetical protein [archaeon]
MIKKKSQEEIVGFVLIVVIVSIILVVILGILMRKPAISSDNLEVSQFLESMMKYTTKCAIGYEPNYASIGELIGDCYDDKTCTSGDKACAVLEDSFNKILESSWPVSAEGYYSGYALDAGYAQGTDNNVIISVSKGECTSFRGADTFFEHQGGVITITLKICTKS